jgi:hypothetical protein
MEGQPIDETGWRDLLGRPRFRAAAEANAAAICALHDPLTPVARWLLNDVGRATTFTRLFFHLTVTGRVTTADLVAGARARKWPSGGRVLQIIERGLAAGLLALEAGEGGWKGRRLLVQPELVELYRRRAAAEIEAAAMVAPEVAPALQLTERDPFLFAFLAGVARVDAVGTGWRGPPNPAIRHFLQAEAGLTMLYDLIGRQAPARGRLLEEAPISRRALAKRFHMSRSHVENVFAAAADAGWLSLTDRNRVVFSPEMSDQAERHFATTFFAMAQSARWAMQTFARGAHSGREARVAP